MKVSYTEDILAKFFNQYYNHNMATYLYLFITTLLRNLS